MRKSYKTDSDDTASSDAAPLAKRDRQDPLATGRALLQIRLGASKPLCLETPPMR